MKIISGFIVLLLLSISSPAQLLEGLKKTAKGLATKENLDKAASLTANQLEKARAEFDSADFDYAILLSDNSGLFDVKEKGEFAAKATSVAGITASLYKNAELTDEQRARSHRQSGELFYGYGWFASAEKKFALAKKTYEETGLTEDLGYLKTISSQGLLYATMGRFTQAESFTAEALDLRKSKLGEENAGVAASLNNYGVLHYNLGRFNESEKDLAAALIILGKNNLQAAMPFAIVLNNEAMLFQAIGRYEEAEKKLKAAIAIAEKLQSSKSTNHLKFLSNLALLYQQMGKYAEAETIYLGMEKRLGKNNPDLASMLNNQAALYIVMGKEDKVEELLKKSSGIYKSNFGENNPAYAKAISDLGNFYRYKERYKEAQPLLEKAVAVREEAFGKTHPMYAQSREDLAILFWKLQNFDQAYSIYREVMDNSLDFINRYFPPMSESEKTKYWDVLSPRFQRFYNFALDASASNKNTAQDLYDYQIATKALLLNSTNKVKQSIFASGDAQLIKDYVSWIDQKENLARLYAYSKTELKEQKINLDSLERAANAMEKKLSERSKDFSQNYGATKTSFSQIKNLLTDNEAVVEIIRIQNYGQKFTPESKYVAMLLTKAAPLPKIISLDNGQQLDTRYYKYYRNTIQQKMEDQYSYDQYWAKIDAELAGKRSIFVSPDGVYNQMNLNTLRKPGGDYVINRYDLTVLGNSKDLINLRSKKATATKKNATLLGFPDYGGASINALPGTKVEIDGIAKLLKTSGYQVSQLMQKNASEASLKNIKGPALLHIATHGYFLKDVDIEGSAFGVHLENANDNPLLRSGLMLAGAAGTVSGTAMPNLESNDNGVLTAYEAMNLNLQGTSLIVLSACETGLGDVKAGEGVYGLQRAFQVAGAEALIMSLWKVDDAATQQLMTNFYTNWIKLGNKQKAFKQAQLQLMTKYKEPYYWGAFVMLGN
ncbi:MAG TPA: CHAT domain-containing tetratricopeptide repeat protein [Chryseosolibacter sp.]